MREENTSGFDNLDNAFLTKLESLNKDNTEKEGTEEEGTKEEILSPFELQLKELGIGKDDVLDMAIQLVETGYVEEKGALLGGKITFVFRSGKMEDSREFVDLFEALSVTKQTTVDYNFNVNTVGLILREFNGESTGDTVQERSKYIEKNVPMPIFRKLLKEANSFGKKVGLLSEDDISLFF